VSRGYPTQLANKYVDCGVFLNTKRVVDGELQVTRPPEHPLARVLPGRRGWLEPDWVVYRMRTKSKKDSAVIRARTRGR
jgi:hypothetical protein